ncbi:aminopeptidase PepB [Vibrio sp. SS-MA-C1-2]|uniref:aminopeptidase PepB n=1 Tax=Vibrio sp. SS-MA-C1-2 TaxID=2908646 RepID=UPI001F1F3230|nr:aminopeptidase PepB [Vibrio sp. SS-MA-C1-2]UJF18963.1 aminopeptidase PepB [Vibrio sp. SS-MA-C1-2]
MSTHMPVVISLQAAEEQWGANALVSFNNGGATIHLTENSNEDVVQKAARKIANQGIKSVELAGDKWTLEQCWVFAQGFRSPLGELDIVWPTSLSEQDESQLDARLVAVNWARDITNLTGEQLSPERLASRAAEFLKGLDPESVKFKMVKGNDLLEEGWTGTYTVGRGSARKPVMLRLDYNPTKDPEAPVHTVIVGKGITFDSGGYSLKPSGFMNSMKADMGGSAIATAALALAIMNGVDYRIKLVLCCAENMVSSKAYKLGDIITYKNGKTVEVMNTDAEGRLVMADGLIYASSHNPQRIIDCATLTGAAKAALGNDYHALFSFDQALANKALKAADQVNEGLWQLPLADMHRHMLPSDFADLSNISSGQYSPGASTAAGFLSHFVEDYKKGWLHFDCSAAYRKTASNKWAVGGTGQGVRTLAQLLLNKK